MSPPITERLWHGGVPGLRPGDLITPGHHRPGITGCPICAGRDAGNTDQIDPPSRRPDKIHHPDRRMTIEDRAARLTRAFTRAAAALASAMAELDSLHADLAAARSDR